MLKFSLPSIVFSCLLITVDAPDSSTVPTWYFLTRLFFQVMTVVGVTCISWYAGKEIDEHFEETENLLREIRDQRQSNQEDNQTDLN
jgi:hypothetical protein